jgi:hypothetical protein
VCVGDRGDVSLVSFREGGVGGSSELKGDTKYGQRTCEGLLAVDCECPRLLRVEWLRIRGISPAGEPMGALDRERARNGSEKRRKPTLFSYFLMAGGV